MQRNHPTLRMMWARALLETEIGSAEPAELERNRVGRCFDFGPPRRGSYFHKPWTRLDASATHKGKYYMPLKTGRVSSAFRSHRQGVPRSAERWPRAEAPERGATEWPLAPGHALRTEISHSPEGTDTNEEMKATLSSDDYERGGLPAEIQTIGCTRLWHPENTRKTRKLGARSAAGERTEQARAKPGAGRSPHVWSSCPHMYTFSRRTGTSARPQGRPPAGPP